MVDTQNMLFNFNDNKEELQKHSQKYLDFVNKFKNPKTEDDCYTPPEIYTAVLQFCKEEFNLEGKKILRPFYPNGNYQAENYTDDIIVIDNPPFSIMSEIVTFYLSQGIKFFLFYEGLRVLQYSTPKWMGVCCCTCLENVIYDNGAEIKTAFLTNMYDDNRRIFASYRLNELVGKANKEVRRRLNNHKKPLNKFIRPANVVTFYDLQKALEVCGDIILTQDDYVSIREINNYKLYGCNLIVSDNTIQKMRTPDINIIAKYNRADELNKAIILKLSEQQQKALDRLNEKDKQKAQQ